MAEHTEDISGHRSPFSVLSFVDPGTGVSAYPTPSFPGVVVRVSLLANVARFFPETAMFIVTRVGPVLSREDLESFRIDMGVPVLSSWTGFRMDVRA